MPLAEVAPEIVLPSPGVLLAPLAIALALALALRVPPTAGGRFAPHSTVRTPAAQADAALRDPVRTAPRR